MNIAPHPQDTAKETELKAEIDMTWKRRMELQHLLDAADAAYGNARAQLRLLQEGLVEGETVVLTTGPRGKVFTGLIETSIDAPHLWLRVINKDGAQSNRRLRLDERADLSRPNGERPVRLHLDTN